MYFNCIVQDPSYHNMDIGTMWHCSLVSCTPSQSIGRFFGCALFCLFCCWVSPCAPFTISLIEFYFIVIFIIIVLTVIEIFMAILLILNYTFRLSAYAFSKCATPCMFPSRDNLLEYWIGHVIFGLLYAMFTFSTRKFYRGVAGFVADCPCGVWCRGLTTCLLHVGPPFGNLV